MRNSLSAHLRQGDQHAAMPFHAECPICRDERLAGTLEPSRLVPARGSAALAAGVLALSAAVPPATIAQEPDQVREGVVAPDAPVDDHAHNPDFDPGGTSVVLPDEPAASPSPTLPASDILDADGPVEPDTDADLQMPVEGAGDEAPAVDVSQTQPPAAEPPPAAETPPAATPPAPPTATEPTTPVSPSADDEEDPFETERRRKEADRRRASGPEDRSVRARGHADYQEATVAEPAASSGGDHMEPVATAVSVAANGVAPGVASATKGDVTVAAGDRIDRSDRVYVVREGDSLWSIAADRLGDEASVAAIAREVNRLWQLNDDRIATGDPDLLRVGTRLALR